MSDGKSQRLKTSTLHYFNIIEKLCGTDRQHLPRQYAAFLLVLSHRSYTQFIVIIIKKGISNSIDIFIAPGDTQNENAFVAEFVNVHIKRRLSNTLAFLFLCTFHPNSFLHIQIDNHDILTFLSWFFFHFSLPLNSPSSLFIHQCGRILKNTFKHESHVYTCFVCVVNVTRLF